MTTRPKQEHRPVSPYLVRRLREVARKPRAPWGELQALAEGTGHTAASLRVMVHGLRHGLSPKSWESVR
jgi:hypothetical protein